MEPITIDELKQKRIWVCWHYEKRKDKQTKVPITASGIHTGTDDSHSGDWMTYQEAREAAEKNGYNGVGFVIPKGFFFLDADDKQLDDPFIKLLLERFQSYTEWSVSGTGIHIYGQCDLSKLPVSKTKDGKLKIDSARYYVKNPNNQLELYIGGLTNRFAVFTGNVIADKPLAVCTEALRTTFNKDMRKKEPVRFSEKRDSGSEEDFDLICSLRKQKNGEKFKKLFDLGDFSDYGSQSEADAALCALIAFRTGNDPERIDRIFRDSALYRQKWEREDYRTATIQYGIDACGGQFHRSVMPHEDFIRFDADGMAYVSTPKLVKYVRKNLIYILVRDSGKQGLLKFVYNDGVYRLYSNDMFMGEIKKFIAAYDEELVCMRTLNETLGQINTDLNYVSQDELNADESIINFKNGLLRVSEDDLELEPHDPAIYSTIQIPCEWTGKPSPTPVFDKYIKTLTDNDPGVEQLLLEFIGACLSNVKGWRMKKALFLVGKGDTGKSQLKSLVELLLGKGNFASLDLREIEARFGTGVIYGTRLAGSSDMSFVTVTELKTFKLLTGGDEVPAEFKGQQGFTYRYNGLLWFCMNRLPRFGGDDGQWVYDRIMVVKCPNVIPKEKQDKHLLDKMYAERDGIVYKAITAFQQVLRNGCRFSEPESVRKAREEYMADNNTAISFFHECMCRREAGKVSDGCTANAIYDAYRSWCENNNNGYAKTAKEFREALSSYLGTTYKDMTVHTERGTCFRDYTLNEEAMEDYVGFLRYA